MANFQVGIPTQLPAGVPSSVSTPSTQSFEVGLVTQTMTAHTPLAVVGDAGPIFVQFHDQSIEAFTPTDITPPVITPAVVTQTATAYTPSVAMMIDPALASITATPYDPSFLVIGRIYPDIVRAGGLGGIVQGDSDGGSGSGIAGVTLDVPADAEVGDYLFMFGRGGGGFGNPFNTGSGYTNFNIIANVEHSAGADRTLYVYWREVDGTEPATYFWGQTSDFGKTTSHLKIRTIKGLPPGLGFAEATTIIQRGQNNPSVTSPSYTVDAGAYNIAIVWEGGGGSAGNPVPNGADWSAWDSGVGDPPISSNFVKSAIKYEESGFTGTTTWAGFSSAADLSLVTIATYALAPAGTLAYDPTLEVTGPEPGLVDLSVTAHDPVVDLALRILSPALATQLATTFDPTFANPGPTQYLTPAVNQIIMQAHAPTVTATTLVVGPFGLEQQLVTSFAPSLTHMLNLTFEQQLVTILEPTVVPGPVLMYPALAPQVMVAYEAGVNVGQPVQAGGITVGEVYGVDDVDHSKVHKHIEWGHAGGRAAIQRPHKVNFDLTIPPVDPDLNQEITVALFKENLVQAFTFTEAMFEIYLRLYPAVASIAMTAHTPSVIYMIDPALVSQAVTTYAPTVGAAFDSGFDEGFPY